MKVSKNTQINFPYHTEFGLQHVDHFKQINLVLKKMLEGVKTAGGGESSVPKWSDFFGLWSEIGSFWTKWSKNGLILHSKV